MNTVTYSQNAVIEFLNKEVIPVQVLFDSQPLATDYKLKWTPTIITMDDRGNEHHRTVGYLSPEEFIPSILLGIGKTHFETDRFNEALMYLDRVIAEYPKSNSTPEAVYLQGVCSYKNTNDPKFLKKAYEKLQAGYPSSEWTQRAYPYRLL